jgi:hypothetical protein
MEITKLEIALKDVSDEALLNSRLNRFSLNSKFSANFRISNLRNRQLYFSKNDPDL